MCAAAAAAPKSAHCTARWRWWRLDGHGHRHPPAAAAPHPACEHVPPYRHPLTSAWSGREPLGLPHPPTHARSPQASLTCLPAHPPGRRPSVVMVSARASQPARCKAHSAREPALVDPLHSVAAHVAGRPYASTCTAADCVRSRRPGGQQRRRRLVLGRALTAAAGPPGALNRVMGVLVSPCILHAIPASRPSHNLSDGLLCLPPYRRRC